jgi:hypothetical protein
MSFNLFFGCILKIKTFCKMCKCFFLVVVMLEAFIQILVELFNK